MLVENSFTKGTENFQDIMHFMVSFGYNRYKVRKIGGKEENLKEIKIIRLKV